MRKHETSNGQNGATPLFRPPTLHAGDTLTRAEFLRRWAENPQIKFAELIGGVVYMPSPTSFRHGESENDMACFLGTYAAHTTGVPR